MLYMRSIRGWILFGALAIPVEAHAFPEIPITYDDNGYPSNAGTVTSSGAPMLSGSELGNACAQYPMTTREDVFQWINWLRSCGILSEDDAERYAPGYKTVAAAWVRAKWDALIDPTKGGDALAHAQRAILANASGLWTYPIFIDASTSRPVSALMSDLGPVYAPHFFDWVRYYKVHRAGGHIQGIDLLDTENVQGCYMDGQGPHVASGGVSLVLAGACAETPSSYSLRIDSLGEQASSRGLRCRSEDSFSGSPWLAVAADARNKWAYGCRHISTRVYSHLYGNADASLEKLQYYISYARDMTGTAACPFADPATLATWTTCFPAWKPETDGNYAPYHWDATGRYASCGLPAGVMPFTQCEFGCYAPEQRILFSDGHQAIADAVSAGRLDVMVVDPQATMNDLRLSQGTVGAYVAHPAAGPQPMVTVTMDSGAVLHVAPSHPLVAEDGALRPASALQTGDRLVRADGTFEPVKSVVSAIEEVPLYDVSTRSTGSTSKLIVTSGYLSASDGYEDPETARVQRQMLRRGVPESHVQ